MKQVNQVGVDVDSEELVSMMRRGGQRLPLARFANSAGGHKKFIRWATKGARPVRVCLEATGIYSLEFALALHDVDREAGLIVGVRRERLRRAGRDREGRTPWCRTPGR